MGDALADGAEAIDRVFGSLSGAALRLLWRAGELSVAEAGEQLRRERGQPLAYTTVLTILGRLHDKGLLERRKVGRHYRYRATMTQAEAMEHFTGRAVDQLLARYGTLALREFAERLGDLDPRLRSELIELASKHRRTDDERA
jgi:predicted transcriptional regulator